MKKLLLFAAVAAGLSVNAQNWQVRLRGVSVQPVEKSTIGTIGGNASVSNAFIPELDFTYFFNKNIAAELILGTSKHDVVAKGTALGDVDLGSVRLLPPTLTVQYHFYPTKSLKPYVGTGINYTIFYDEGKNPAAAVTKVEYKDNVGFALQAGVDYFINEKFFLNLDAKKLFLQTDVKVHTVPAIGATVPADVKLNPWVLGFGVGMKF
ncbi:MAG: OmpW family outer membrane protein [Cruoricaptor ignavus]|nr:OmpW family outer membrane protein [Cruoricaptor ignavus]